MWCLDFHYRCTIIVSIARHLSVLLLPLGGIVHFHPSFRLFQQYIDVALVNLINCWDSLIRCSRSDSRALDW